MDLKPLFSYRAGKSAVHRLPAALKVCFLFVLPAVVFFLPLYAAVVWIAVNTALAFYAGFTLRQQIHDLKPVFYYIVFFISVQLASFFFGGQTDIMPLVKLVVKLVCAIQITSLFFSTTTSLELKQALEKILPKDISLLFVLFLTFIPLLFSVWDRLYLSWKARAGKNGPKKLFVLFPVFISTALFKARNLFYSLQNRS